MLINNISDTKFLSKTTENAALVRLNSMILLSSVMKQTRTDIFTQHAASNAGKVVNKIISLFQCNAPL